MFEANGRRAEKSLSDIKGTEIYAHVGRPRGVFRELTDVLVNEPHQPTVRDLEAIFNDLRKEAVTIKKELRRKSLFHARPFRELVIRALALARKRIPTLLETV